MYKLEDGTETTVDDPKRTIWYSANGKFWTDDWSKLGTENGIPVCPQSRCPGMYCTAQEWFDGALIFEREGNTEYIKFLNEHNGKYMVNGIINHYEMWKGRN